MQPWPTRTFPLVDDLVCAEPDNLNVTLKSAESSQSGGTSPAIDTAERWTVISPDEEQDKHPLVLRFSKT